MWATVSAFAGPILAAIIGAWAVLHSNQVEQRLNGTDGEASIEDMRQELTVTKAALRRCQRREAKLRADLRKKGIL